MPRVRSTADVLQREKPEMAEAIVRRWIGDSARYGKI
jgi:hypothetical protein